MAEKKKRKVLMSTEVLRGVYANYMEVAHTQNEFVLTFANIIGEQAIATARVLLTPTLAKEIIKALRANVRTYEETFRTRIKAPKETPPRVGFV